MTQAVILKPLSQNFASVGETVSVERISPDAFRLTVTRGEGQIIQSFPNSYLSHLNILTSEDIWVRHARTKAGKPWFHRRP